MATLYHVPTSRSLRVLWTLEEIGATVEVKSLEFGRAAGARVSRDQSGRHAAA